MTSPGKDPADPDRGPEPTWPPPGVKPLGNRGGRRGQPPQAAVTDRRIRAGQSGSTAAGPTNPDRSRHRRNRPHGRALSDVVEIERVFRSRQTTLIVDGYNLSRAAWSGLGLEEERRRTVALLEELRARHKLEVTVVFDGTSGTVAPAASRSVRVRFSADGSNADQLIGELVRASPAARLVLVVSSDREVAEHSHQAGASTVDAATFLVAAGR